MENAREKIGNYFFAAALIVKQKSCFSLNDSHSFNRAAAAHPQHWQHDAVLRWNFCKKSSGTSLDLPRLHVAFIFVLCASVALRVTQLSAIKSDHGIQIGRAGMRAAAEWNLPSPCTW